MPPGGGLPRPHPIPAPDGTTPEADPGDPDPGDPYTAQYVTTNDPPPLTLPGEPWPFAPERYWQTPLDSTGICRPEVYGIALCSACLLPGGELWPGQAHHYCDSCRGVPKRPVLVLAGEVQQDGPPCEISAGHLAATSTASATPTAGRCRQNAARDFATASPTVNRSPNPFPDWAAEAYEQ